MDTEVGRIVGERVRALRIQKGVSLRQFSADHDFNPNVISRVERGEHNVTLVTLFRLCRALESTPAELLRGLS
jgi:transcriptional regulator with XRE-family HTH domain